MAQPARIAEMLQPGSVAVIGASDDLSKFGGRLFHLLVRHRFDGAIYPINRRRESLSGIRCYAQISATPRPPDMAVMAVPRDHVEAAVRECAQAGTRLAIVITAKFWPSLLIRNHGMSVAEAGLVLSLVFGISGAIGTFSGGFLVDRLTGKDRRWYAWVPLLGVGLATLPYYFAILSHNTAAALLVLFLAGIVKSFYLGPCIAASHAMVPPRMRALTSAVLFFVLNMIGLGLGPLFTGLMSDLLAPLSGADNLRHTMCATTTISLLAVPMFWQASRHLPSNLSAKACPTGAH